MQQIKTHYRSRDPLAITDVRPDLIFIKGQNQRTLDIAHFQEMLWKKNIQSNIASNSPIPLNNRPSDNRNDPFDNSYINGPSFMENIYGNVSRQYTSGARSLIYICNGLHKQKK